MPVPALDTEEDAEALDAPLEVELEAKPAPAEIETEAAALADAPFELVGVPTTT